MKKIILAVILLAAAGGISYYLHQKKKQNIAINFQRENILGKWKLDSLSTKNNSASLIIGIIGMIDSSLMKYEYDFKKEGIAVRFLKDSAQRDTIHYEWEKGDHLIWKEKGDSIEDFLTVNTLNKDSLVLRSKDSTMFYFKKVK